MFQSLFNFLNIIFLVLPTNFCALGIQREKLRLYKYSVEREKIGVLNPYQQTTKKKKKKWDNIDTYHKT